MSKGQIPPHAFKGRGIGLKTGGPSTTVRFPEDITVILDAMDGEKQQGKRRKQSKKQDFIRNAVVEKMQREGVLPSDTIAPSIPLQQKQIDLILNLLLTAEVKRSDAPCNSWMSWSQAIVILSSYASDNAVQDSESLAELNKAKELMAIPLELCNQKPSSKKPPHDGAAISRY